MGIRRFFLGFGVFAVLASGFLLAGCRKEAKIRTYVSSAEALNLKVRDTKSDQTVSPADIHSHGHTEDGEICVVFGYGFNTENFYSQIIRNLDALYGLESNGGMILPLIFPDDLKKISLLRDTLNSRNILGVVVLGAPEGTNSVFARLQDEFDGSIPYPVFSLFPQDDILGQESTSDFVLEYEHKTDEESMEEQLLQHIDSDASDITMRTVALVLNCEGPLARDQSLLGVVQRVAGKRKVVRYTDSETLIPSSNHFIIERED